MLVHTLHNVALMQFSFLDFFATKHSLHTPLCTSTPLLLLLLPQVIHFFTSVRGKEMRQLTISNKTNSTWLLKPIIDGEYWSGPESISIPPNQNHHYELTYQPLVMTPEPTKHQVCTRLWFVAILQHIWYIAIKMFVCKATNVALPPQGSIFFPLPDGSGLLYNLLGTAEPPKQAGSVQQEIPCKTHHTELLAVKNWLKRPQRCMPLPPTFCFLPDGAELEN